jgi:hypothetical protein
VAPAGAKGSLGVSIHQIASASERATVMAAMVPPRSVSRLLEPSDEVQRGPHECAHRFQGVIRTFGLFTGNKPRCPRRPRTVTPVG